jgi:hypothetical protein
MNTLETRGKVRRVLEEDGEFLVSITGHDGYFRVPETAKSAALRQQVLSAQEQGNEISVVFDRDLNILALN